MKGELQVPLFASRYGPKKTLYPCPHKVDEHLAHLEVLFKAFWIHVHVLSTRTHLVNWGVEPQPVDLVPSHIAMVPHQGQSRCGATPKQVTSPRRACHPTLSGCASTPGDSHIFSGIKNSSMEYIGFSSGSRNIIIFPQGRHCLGETLHLLNSLIR
jgi:hypothetical protein